MSALQQSALSRLVVAACRPQQRAFAGPLAHTASSFSSTIYVRSNSTASEHSLPPPQGPLVGIKVLDLGQVVAGNFCGALLAYFGADVIKVEPPKKGDALRSLRTLDSSGTSLWWRCHGRNRRCVTINLNVPEGRELVKRLSSRVDVLVENFRPGVMEGWGLGPADLKPDLVYARISGYGQTGPRAPDPGYASVCEAYGGFRHLNGYPDRPPVRPNISLGDTLAGLHAAFGVVMALLHKQRAARTGGGGGDRPMGQVVDAAISESVFNMLESCVAEVAEAGEDRQPSGSTISGVVPSGTFRTQDGRYVVIGGNGDSVYSRLMAAIGRPDMAASNPAYASNSLRVAAEAEIMGQIEEWVAKHTLEEVMGCMTKARVPAGPILSPAALMAEPQFRARGMVQSAPPPSGGRPVTMPALLPVLSGTPGATRWAGPDLGEHTEEVLRGELGLGDAEMAALRAAGAI
ncbi:hypothetical protein PLESTB_000024800 [Pleodorina starrii]|uniref:Uncharacterized protein n=1 Tax=Pleodorina starrii TaxID=330485 RepID=A0A9W6B8V0_9CHLO|nr:hypothetical protein PLESTM_001109800 [Pleodorina starrii]GLC47779.1 hypothetical protein PLESTB_000024800 [Pleodorina starrii]GLC70805.1 hypothetical protein PLESTF_001035000 [Pleodorina starrii]